MSPAPDIPGLFHADELLGWSAVLNDKLVTFDQYLAGLDEIEGVAC